MSATKTEDISHIRFSSTVFPTAEDKVLWESLTPEQRLAVLRRDEQAGFESGATDHASMAEILAEARRDPQP
jgi:hypothetical protein